MANLIGMLFKRYTEPVTPGEIPSTTYTVTPAALGVNEGDGLSVTVSGTNITDGTYYWTATNSGDFSIGSGSFTITDNSGLFIVTPTADATTEGSESFTVSIRAYNAASATVLATSASVTINDTSLNPPPTYTITPTAFNVNEGTSLTFNVSGTNIVNGTYYWTITNTTDFSVSSGSFSITSNSGSFSVTPASDITTEGAESFTASVRAGSITGTILATSGSVTINDTSTAPTVPFEPYTENQVKTSFAVTGGTLFTPPESITDDNATTSFAVTSGTLFTPPESITDDNATTSFVITGGSLTTV